MPGQIDTRLRDPFRFLLIGVGPHAKRTYVKHLKILEGNGRAELACAVDIEQKRDELTQYRDAHFPMVEMLFVPPFTTAMPARIAAKLDDVVTRLQISCVIISTEPQVHKAYGLWALSRELDIIMDKPITTRKDVTTDMLQACGIAQDYNDLLLAYTELQQRRRTFFLIASHRRYHPAHTGSFEMIQEIAEKTGCPVTNIVSTHCDGQWRLPTELVDEGYHGFNAGHGKISHSGYHFLDTTYRFVKSGWTEEKKPDRIEVISTLITPNGFLKTLTHDDYLRVFGKDYEASCNYTHEQVQKLTADGGEYDAGIQLTFIKDNEPMTIAQINLLHNGFSRRSWLSVKEDWYKGSGRVKHEAHEIRSGPFQTVVMDSRQANDKHDRSKPSSAKIGTDNHFEINVFRNSDLLNEDEPLKSYSMVDMDRRNNVQLPGIYTENVKKGILWEALDCLEGVKKVEEMVSNIEDHSVPANLMSAAYISHIRRCMGENPIVSIDLDYTPYIRPSWFTPFELINQIN